MGSAFRDLLSCLWLVLALTGSGIAVQSQPVVPLSEDYIVDVWQTEDGLPQNSVTSIVQTQDGYLWFATFNGLVRFDGVKFTVFDAVNTPQLKRSRITKLYADRSGKLWIISEEGELAVFSEGTFKAFSTADGLPWEGPSVITEDASGEIWVASRGDGGCQRFSGGKFLPDTSTGTPLNRFFAIIGDSDGNLWAGRKTDLLRWRQDGLVPVKTSEAEGQLEAKVFALERSKDGGLWVATSRGAQKFRHGQWEKRLPSGIPLQTAASICEDLKGNVWIGTWTQGLFRFNPNGELARMQFPGEPSLEAIRCVFEDREGNIWLGVEGTGLYRLKTRVVRTYSKAHGLMGKSVRSLSESADGRIFLATQEGIEVISQAGGWSVSKLSLPVKKPWTTMASRDGSLWVGCHGGGFFRIQGTNTQAIWPELEKGSYNSPIFSAIFEDSRGSIWVGCPGILSRVADNRLVDFPESMQLPMWDIRAIAEDRAGRLFLGLNGEGLKVREKEQWTALRRADGLADERIWAIYPDKEDSIWLGSFGGGLSRLKGRSVFNFPFGPFGLPQFVYSILEDDFGYLWLGSSQGIFRVSRERLNAVADGLRKDLAVTKYDRSDGMRSSECAGSRQPVALKSRDGRLWFATVDGIAVADPKELRPNILPPPVVIEQIRIDDSPAQSLEKPADPQNHLLPPAGISDFKLAAKPKVPLRIPPGTERVEISYTALSYRAPARMRFRYKLEGIDAAWTEADGRRVATFQRLPPGPYQFRVTACNDDNVWNETGAVLAFIVLPHVWQTWWFQLAGSIAGLGMIGAGIRYLSIRRIRLDLARLERQNAINQERGRIARDMHDDMGAILTQISMLGELAAGDASSVKPTSHLSQLTHLSRDAVRKLDELVWAINPRNDTLASFVDYLSYYIEEYLQPFGVRGQIEAPNPVPPLNLWAESRHHLLLVIKEALNNAVKHSKTREVRVRVAVDAGMLSVVIEDRGQGFNPETSGQGDGIRNMRQRTETLGGEFGLESHPGEGTRIEIRLDLTGRT